MKGNHLAPYGHHICQSFLGHFYWFRPNSPISPDQRLHLDVNSTGLRVGHGKNTFVWYWKAG
jgi:hypothetical protein